MKGNLFVFFFFSSRRRHTSFDCDWSSDVCSSDLCLDRDGAVWVAAFDEDAFIRLDHGGRELQRIEVPGRRAIACVLGGASRRTLFCLSAATSYEELRHRKSSARIDVVEVEIA